MLYKLMNIMRSGGYPVVQETLNALQGNFNLIKDTFDSMLLPNGSVLILSGDIDNQAVVYFKKDGNNSGFYITEMSASRPCQPSRRIGGNLIVDFERVEISTSEEKTDISSSDTLTTWQNCIQVGKMTIAKDLHKVLGTDGYSFHTLHSLQYPHFYKEKKNFTLTPVSLSLNNLDSWVVIDKEQCFYDAVSKILKININFTYVEKMTSIAAMWFKLTPATYDFPEAFVATKSRLHVLKRARGNTDTSLTACADISFVSASPENGVFVYMHFMGQEGSGCHWYISGEVEIETL